MMGRMADDWQRLAATVRERRYDLGLTQEQVRQAGGPSTATQRHIEGAAQSHYLPVILARLEAGLGWGRGSVRAILAGREPHPADPPPPAVRPAPPPGPDPADVMVLRIGEAIAAEMGRIAAGIGGEITAARRLGVPEDAMFTDPGERALWAIPLMSEDDRVLRIAALRSMRLDRLPRYGRGPVELAG